MNLPSRLSFVAGLLLALGGFFAAQPAWAESAPVAPPPKLGLPLACLPGETCWLVNHVDHDPGPGVRDYGCRKRSYNGHTGVDFALRDYSKMDDGVAVVAAAAGTVLRLRDGMLDGDVSLVGRAAVAGRNCGNSVIVGHDGGWETAYCHLRRNSLVVRRGQKVAKGDKLGLVGSSGLSQFPHVHLALRHKGRVIDPFVGLSRRATCGPGEQPLWDARTWPQVRDSGTALYDAGFAPVKVNAVGLRRGFYRESQLSPKSAALVFWVDAFWVEPGDRLQLTITRPDGRVLVEEAKTINKTQARHMQFAGKRRTVDWRPGVYRGEAVLTRRIRAQRAGGNAAGGETAAERAVKAAIAEALKDPDAEPRKPGVFERVRREPRPDAGIRTFHILREVEIK